jgi:hypothetical protein
LGFEFEVGLWEFISVELVPVFVVNSEPPMFNFTSRADELHQESNGLGPISGTSIAAGFWLSGKPLKGTFLRAMFTDYGYTYKTSAVDGGTFDKFSHTDRWFMGMIGSNSRWGAFTLQGGFGLGVELNKEVRCLSSNAVTPADATDSGCHRIDIALDPGDGGPIREAADVSSPFYPIVISTRIALGVSID